MPSFLATSHSPGKHAYCVLGRGSSDRLSGQVSRGLVCLLLLRKLTGRGPRRNNTCFENNHMQKAGLLAKQKLQCINSCMHILMQQCWRFYQQIFWHMRTSTQW